VQGSFDGILVARKRLLVRATGQVSGTISYGELEIERGGKISGEISQNGESAPSRLKPAQVAWGHHRLATSCSLAGQSLPDAHRGGGARADGPTIRSAALCALLSISLKSENCSNGYAPGVELSRGCWLNRAQSSYGGDGGVGFVGCRRRTGARLR
jgi:hypothetical protein